MLILSFDPKEINKSLITVLNDRAKDVITQRYGIGKYPEKKTLEAIGQVYGITRERVRQLENFALNTIRQSNNFKNQEEKLAELESFISKKGGVLSENEILDLLSEDGDQQTKNNIYFLLVLGEDFVKIKEDDYFHHRWTTSEEKSKKIHEILDELHKKITKDVLLAEKEIISIIQDYSKDILGDKVKDDTAISWLKMSKMVGKNVLGEWGNMKSENIKPRGVRDLAFTVLRKNGSPMHFSEITKAISDIFPRKAHSATVHNELIKDSRFILVGRGMYALKEWGYASGTVRQIIKNILKASGPLHREEIVKKVLKERYVKENTILVNLQNSKYFKRNKNGAYSVV